GEDGELEQVAPGSDSRCCLRGGFCGRAVAVRQLPDVPRGAQPFLRGHLLRLQFAPVLFLRALSVLSDRAIGRRVPDGDGTRRRRTPAPERSWLPRRMWRGDRSRIRSFSPDRFG